MGAGGFLAARHCSSWRVGTGAWSWLLDPMRDVRKGSMRAPAPGAFSAPASGLRRPGGFLESRHSADGSETRSLRNRKSSARALLVRFAAPACCSENPFLSVCPNAAQGSERRPRTMRRATPTAVGTWGRTTLPCRMTRALLRHAVPHQNPQLCGRPTGCQFWPTECRKWRSEQAAAWPRRTDHAVANSNGVS